MKKIQVMLMAILLSTVLFAQTINDANAEPRNLSGFHAIKI